ncbi:MAG: hypothetical protein ABSF09_12025 [Candidatus Bathyarchaeia archaeon]
MSNMESFLAVTMGIIILIVDFWWTWTSYTYLPWLAAGVLIGVASAIWIGLEYDLWQSK